MASGPLRFRQNRNYSEAAPQIFSPSSTPTCQRMILIPRGKYEDTGAQKVARDATRRHAHQSDPAEKLAREVDQPPACDNGLVLDQKEHRNWKVPPGASYGNALKAERLRKLRRSTCFNHCPAILSGNGAFVRSRGITSEHKRGNFTYENARQIKSDQMRILVRQRCH
jgi:hypothetical protein